MVSGVISFGVLALVWLAFAYLGCTTWRESKPFSFGVWLMFLGYNCFLLNGFGVL